MKDFLDEWKKQVATEAAIQKIIEGIRRYVHAQWTLGALHGISHWDRVIVPDPDRLATEKGKEIARNTDYQALINQ